MDNVSISYQDARNLLIIIDSCSERGAFKGPELAGVGQTRNNIVSAIQNFEKERDKKD